MHQGAFLCANTGPEINLERDATFAPIIGRESISVSLPMQCRTTNPSAAPLTDAAAPSNATLRPSRAMQEQESVRLYPGDGRRCSDPEEREVTNSHF